MKRVMLICVVVVALMSSCGGAKTPESVADSFTRAWASGDYDGALKYASEEWAEALGYVWDSYDGEEDGNYEASVAETVANQWKLTPDGEPRVDVADGRDIITIRYRTEGVNGEPYRHGTVSLAQKDGIGEWEVIYFDPPIYL